MQRMILSREEIRSQYINISQPDMTRVTIKVNQPIKEGRIYKNIVSGAYHFYYDYVIKGTIGITTVYVTGV